MQEVKHVICPTYISDLLNQQRNRYNLRNTYFAILHLNAVRYGKHSIKYLGLTLCRSPKDTRNVTDLNLFNKQMKQMALPC